MKQHILVLLLILAFTSTVAAASDTLGPEFSVNIKTDGNQVHVYGTVNDITPENETVSGVDRVELKFDIDQWVTADLTGSEYSYDYELKNSGYHSLQVRAYDESGNPSETVVKTYTATFSDPETKFYLSDYVSIKDAKFSTFDSTRVTTIEEGQDVAAEFDIINDADEDIRVRVTMKVGSYEEEEDLRIRAGSDEEIDQWFPADTFKQGTNLLEIEVMDLGSRDIIADKELTLKVIPTVEEEPLEQVVESPDDDIPEWFVAIAELNGMTLPAEKSDTAQLQAEIDDLETKVNQQNTDITNLRNELNAYKTQPASASFGGIEDKYLALLVIVGIIGYLKRDEISQRFGSGSHVTEERYEDIPEIEPPRPE